MNGNKNQDESDLQNISEIDLINRITKSIKTKNDSASLDIGDDAAILKFLTINDYCFNGIITKSIRYMVEVR